MVQPQDNLMLEYSLEYRVCLPMFFIKGFLIVGEFISIHLENILFFWNETACVNLFVSHEVSHFMRDGPDMKFAGYPAHVKCRMLG